MTTREQLVKILYRAHGLLANKVDVIKADIEELCAKELEPIIQSERQQAVEEFAERVKIEIKLDTQSTDPGNDIYPSQVPMIFKRIDQVKEEYKEDQQ